MFPRLFVWAMFIWMPYVKQWEGAPCFCSKPAVSQAMAHSPKTITTTTLLHSCSFYFLWHSMSGRQFSTFLSTCVCEWSYHTWQTMNARFLLSCYLISVSQHQLCNACMLDPYHYSHWSLYYRVHEDRNQYAIVSDTFQNLAACSIHLLPSPPLLSVLWNDNTMPYGGILLTVWRYTEICVTGRSIWVGFHSVLTCLSHFRSSMHPL